MAICRRCHLAWQLLKCCRPCPKWLLRLLGEAAYTVHCNTWNIYCSLPIYAIDCLCSLLGRMQREKCKISIFHQVCLLLGQCQQQVHWLLSRFLSCGFIWPEYCSYPDNPGQSVCKITQFQQHMVPVDTLVLSVKHKSCFWYWLGLLV